ncbi:MAG: putative porin [Saprospiraceae bacterium]
MNTALRIFTLIVLVTLVSSVTLKAQIRDLGQNALGSSEIKDTLDSGTLPLDTPVVMKYVLMGDPDANYSIKDTFTWEDTRHSPLRFDQAHLGNLGSASRSLAPSLSTKIGFSTGWDQYDPYYLQVDSFKYYSQDVPVTKVKYSQAGQEDTYVSLSFGRSFAKGVNLSMSYDRINQIGEFAHQRQKNTAFGVGVWYNAPSGKYDAFYNYLSNAAISEENGGISEPDLIGSQVVPNLKVPVYLLNGLTTHKHRSFDTKQIFHLIKDSSSPGFDLWMNTNFSTGLYKFADVPLDTSSAYFGSEYRFDQRGIRQFTFEKDFEMSAGISLPWTSARSMIQSSFRYRFISLDQEPQDRKIRELFWEASGDFHWIKALELKGVMSLGVGQASGSYLFKAEGILNTGLVGKFLGYWSIMGRRPYMIESIFFVNQTPIYQYHFNNPFTNDVGVEWNWEKQKLKAGINWLVFDNYIFFDTLRHPAQITNSFSLRRFTINKEFDFSWIGLKANVIWQPDTREELAIPDLIYAAGFYGRLNLFSHKVILMPGIDVTYHNGYHGISYFPVNGRYHLTNGLPIPDYFRMDAVIGMKIRFLKAFVRMEDLAGLWKSRVLYQADYYPHYPGYFRIGIEAGFFN